MGQTVHVRFQGDHATGLEFVEIETPDGESVDVGEWTADEEGAILELELAGDSE